QAAQGDRGGFRSTLSEVLRLTGFITIPSAVGLYVLREPVVDAVLRSGQFDAESARLTAAAFRWYLPGLVLVGSSRALAAALLSLALAAAILLSAGVYFAAARLLGSEEVAVFLRVAPWRRLLGRGRAGARPSRG